jgi:DNA repair ATPase RecN
MSTEVEPSEDYQPVEPTIIKVAASSSILTASAGCQTIVSGDDWVTKSSIALDARKIDRIQAVIDSDMNRTAFFARNWCNETEDASEDLKELTLLWQNDHTALQTHVSLLRGLRMIVEHHKEDAQKQRQYADKVSASVRRLEETINQREKDYDEKLKLREKEYQDRIDALLVKVTALEKGTDVPDAALDEKQASQVSLDRFFGR